jgi:hypothetical protein
MYVCMYVYVYMYVCMYVCMYVYTCNMYSLCIELAAMYEDNREFLLL